MNQFRRTTIFLGRSNKCTEKTTSDSVEYLIHITLSIF